MFLIDTNIHAAYLLQAYEKDDLTRQYLAFYEQLPLIHRVVPDFVLNEFEILMIRAVPSRYQMTPDQRAQMKQVVVDYLQDIFANCTLATPTLTIMKRAFEMYKHYATTSYLSITDSLILAMSEQNNYTLLTKDERMQTLARELKLPLYEPQVSVR